MFALKEPKWHRLSKRRFLLRSWGNLMTSEGVRAALVGLQVTPCGPGVAAPLHSLFPALLATGHGLVLRMPALNGSLSCHLSWSWLVGSWAFCLQDASTHFSSPGPAYVTPGIWPRRSGSGISPRSDGLSLRVDLLRDCGRPTCSRTAGKGGKNGCPSSIAGKPRTFRCTSCV